MIEGNPATVFKRNIEGIGLLVKPHCPGIYLIERFPAVFYNIQIFGVLRRVMQNARLSRSESAQQLLNSVIGVELAFSRSEGAQQRPNFYLETDVHKQMDDRLGVVRPLTYHPFVSFHIPMSDFIVPSD